MNGRSANMLRYNGKNQRRKAACNKSFVESDSRALHAASACSKLVWGGEGGNAVKGFLSCQLVAGKMRRDTRYRTCMLALGLGMAICALRFTIK